MTKKEIEDVGGYKLQRFFQIIFPIIICLLVIVIGTFFLVSNKTDAGFDIGKASDISSAWLIFLLLPSGLLSLAFIAASILVINKLVIWGRSFLPKVRTINQYIQDGTNTICQSSEQPFYLLASIQSILNKVYKKE